MATRKSLRKVALAIFLTASLGQAQQAATGNFYKLDFVVKEVEGTRTVNSRAYSLMVESGSHKYSQVRAGSKVEINRHVVKSNTEGEHVSGEFLDLGVSIDVSDVTETPNGLGFSAGVDVSSLPSGVSPKESPTMIRHNRCSSYVVVPLKKPTVIFSSDSVDSKSTMQVEVSASPIT